jgi:hypothetical protein
LASRLAMCLIETVLGKSAKSKKRLKNVSSIDNAFKSINVIHTGMWENILVLEAIFLPFIGPCSG